MKKIELSEEQIKDIQEKYKNNVKVEELCNEYQVNRKIIYKYTKGLLRHHQDKQWLEDKYYKLGQKNILQMLIN